MPGRTGLARAPPPHTHALRTPPGHAHLREHALEDAEMRARQKVRTHVGKRNRCALTKSMHLQKQIT